MAEGDESPAQQRFLDAPPRIADGAESGGSGTAWTRCGREFRVVIDLRSRGAEVEAVLADYPLLAESGRTPWEAVDRLVARHRVLLERRWSCWEGAR
jgi:hypothetical protein